MKRQTSSFIVLVLLGCAALPACGTTGTTTHFALPLDLPRGEKFTIDVHVASIAMDVNAAYLNAIKVQPWGMFGPDDLKNIEQSLKDTISPYLTTTSDSMDSRMDLHLVVRRYVVSTSNTAGAVLACVAWAATTPKGSVIYKEQFYASNAEYLLTTIGLIKDSVHKAIVRRIATISLEIARNPAAEKQSSIFDNTSISFEEAVSRLPQSMFSLGDPAPVLSPNLTSSAIGLLTPSEISQIKWEAAAPSEPFDWTGYLNKFYEP
jgi:hypothetical protein